MKLDENLAAIHAYLCADGYVIKNPPAQKQKYYMLGFRNTDLILLKDFQNKFEKVFGIKPHLIEGQRCRIGSKKIYEILTKEFGSFSSWKWRMPELNEELSKIWLRAYFDCEGWVFCKKHQNRHIGADCVNENGITQVEKALNNLDIKTIRKYNKKRKIHRILIYGKDNLKKFAKHIGFLHPAKDLKLKEVLEDFVVYEWNFPNEENKLRNYVLEVLRQRARIRKSSNSVRIISNRETNLLKLQKELKRIFNIDSKLNKSINGLGNIYFELSINRKENINYLINNKMINIESIQNVQKTTKKN